MQKYDDYLRTACDKTTENQHNPVPIRTVSEDAILRYLQGCEGPVSPEFAELSESLENMYGPVSVNNFAPEDVVVRRNWIIRMQLRSPVALYTYQQGGTLGHLIFCFRVPHVEKRNETTILQTIEKISPRVFQSMPQDR
jgi:hypothetical protein